MQGMAGRLLPGERVAKCLRCLRTDRDEVEVWQAAGGVRYGGLMVCRSVWVCPCCAAKITEERRRELRQATSYARQHGLRVVMITYTFSHGRADVLADIRQRFKDAYTRMRSGRAAQQLAEDFGGAWAVEAQEVTWGARNAWHPHAHALVFLPVEADIEEFAARSRAMWEHAAAQEGLTMNEHGFRLDDCNEHIADYIAKYGVEPRWQESNEMTKWHVKRGQKYDDATGDEHVTPFELLRRAEQGDQRAGQLFVEYAQAYKGVRQLRWSPQLRKLLGLGVEKTDEEIAEGVADEPGVKLGVLRKEQWWIVLANDCRGELLEVARAGDWELVMKFLADIGALVC